MQGFTVTSIFAMGLEVEGNLRNGTQMLKKKSDLVLLYYINGVRALTEWGAM